MATWSDRTKYQGHSVNFGTWFILIVVNKLLRLKKFGGETSNMTMLQGGYNKGGVKASAGTHDGGGAFDLTAFNWKWRVWLLRLFGCAAWYRPYNWDGRGGGAHIHVEVVGDGTSSAGALKQVLDYLKGLNGLANKAKDSNARPKGLKILFKYPKGTDLALRYAKKDTVIRDQPSSEGKSLGTLKKGAKFTPVGMVKNGSGNYWTANTTGGFVYDGDLTKTAPAKEPTPPKPTVPVPPKPTTPVPSKALTLTVATINVIRWRLGTRDGRKHEPFTPGIPYADRVKGFAKMVNTLGAWIFGTQESGQYKDADTLTKALGEDDWTNVLHGDDAGDITEANHVNEKLKMLAEGKISTGNAPQVAYHNTATYTLQQDTTGSGVYFLFVNHHGDYRPRGKTAASVYDKNREEDVNVLIIEAEQLAENFAKKYGVKNIPVVFVGDFNQDKDDFYDGPGRAMKAHDYVDCETVASSKTGPETTLNGKSTSKVTGRRADRIFVKKGTKVGKMTTIAGWPYTDHNGVGVVLTLDNN